MKYTFGDSPMADERLKRIASFFNPKAEIFIKKNVRCSVETAVDLGCGPGYTTRMLSKASRAKNVIGLDISEPFIKAARIRFPDISFLLHDVTQIPFPVNPDLMYGRFLLSHLIDIKEIIEKWVHELKYGGLLFIDELEDIKTDHSLFRKYIDINNELIKSQGANLFIGKEIEKRLESVDVVYNESVILPVGNYLAAWWFYPNTISIWKTNDYIKSRLTEIEREDIAQQMYEMTLNKSEKSDITWIMKRIIIKKQ